MKSRTAVPSARNSGQEAYPTLTSPRASSAARTFSPVPTGTVLFITSTGEPMSAGRSSITDHTAARLASPEGVGGVPTHTNRKSLPLNASSIDSVNESRSRFAAISSSSPGSWNGTRPAVSCSIRSGTTSRITTVWPSSVRHAPLTRPA